MESPWKQMRDTDINQDLLLAAEIGKSLLERNLELENLLKSSQDYGEEQAIQVDYYMRQLDILRDTNETITHTCEQIESANQQLNDKYEQVQAENKILQGKNLRLWELIGSLEKRNEELNVKLNNIQAGCNEKKNKSFPVIRADHPKPKVHKVIKEDGIVKKYENETCSCSAIVLNLEHEINNLQTNISELKVSLNVAKLQKEELAAQLDDVIEENQVQHRKIVNLKVEINEWEKFAEKEENYRRLAEAFSVKHHIEIEVDSSPEQQTCLSPNSKAKICKAKSCEFLHQPNEICNLKTRNLVNNVLSSVNSSSFLSELDSEYAELVKRYEALLEKCQQEGRLLENPERTRKVQRAIQTLSFDFGKLASADPSPVTPTKDDSVLKVPSTFDLQSHSKVGGDIVPDYRKMFAEIFAIIKQSKDTNDLFEEGNT